MYAVVKTGGKQYRVTEGQRLEVERVDGENELFLDPVLVVDGGNVLSTPDQLSGALVRARVVGESKGPKIAGFTYKAKKNYRRRWGHRQRYSTIEIVGISKGGSPAPPETPGGTGVSPETPGGTGVSPETTD
jgi:large subunit ribosomal protein L21